MILAAFFTVVAVALALGLDVFAVCAGIGMRGFDTGVRFRVGAAFAAAEVAMTIAGAALGRGSAELFGDASAYLGFTALVGVGIYMVIEALRESDDPAFDFSRGIGLFIGSLSISLDSLAVGFSILYLGVPFAVTLAAIALASVASTSLGLTFGRALGRKAEETAALWAGAILIVTGLTFALLKFAGHPA